MAEREAGQNNIIEAEIYTYTANNQMKKNPSKSCYEIENWVVYFYLFGWMDEWEGRQKSSK